MFALGQKLPFIHVRFASKAAMSAKRQNIPILKRSSLKWNGSTRAAVESLEGLASCQQGLSCDHPFPIVGIVEEGVPNFRLD